MRLKTAAGTGALMVFGSMCSGQIAGVITVKFGEQIGAEDLTWLRLVFGSLILIVVARPWRHHFTRSALLNCFCLGVVSAGVTILYMIAITKLPLGTATALQFLGPLTLSVLKAYGAVKWLAVIPAAGVAALTEPWRGTADPSGIFLALGSGVFFAVYIVLTQKAGDEVAGLHTLAISVPVSAIVATFTVDVSAISQISMEVLFVGLGAALMLPVIPYVLELLALRRMTTAAFGTLLGLLPAVALLAGFVFLGQVPRILPLVGIILVVTASIGATMTGSRPVTRKQQAPPERT